MTYTSVGQRDELHHGAPWRSFSRYFVLFRHLRNYLSLRLVAHPELMKISETTLPATTTTEAKSESVPRCGPQYILAVFPHGTHADYRILLDGLLSEVLPDEVARHTRTLAASILFRIPLLREVALWTGCVDARKSVAKQLLTSGHSLIVLPGGQEEQLRTVCGEERVYVRKRRGFVKLALQHNVPVVPVYVFGVSDHYGTSSMALQARRWLLHATGIAWPLTSGASGAPWCPRSIPTTVVFGAPLRLATLLPTSYSAIDLSSDAAVSAAHDQFVAALVTLFDSHKTALGYGDRCLIVE